MIKRKNTKKIKNNSFFQELRANTEEKYKISFCVPVYNTKKEYIKECLNSIINCGLNKDEFEIIVIDDGSDKIDVTEIITVFKLMHIGYNIDVYQHAKNEGLFEARRSAVYIAKGHYIYNVDSDDFLEKDIFRELIDDFYDKDYDVIQTEFNDITIDKKFKHEPIALFNEASSENDTLLRCMYSDIKIPGYVWGKLIKRTIYLKSFEQLPYLNLNFNEDFLQVFFICKNAKTIISTPSYVTHNYRRETGMTNLSNGLDIKRFKSYLRYVEVMKIVDPKYTNSEKLKKWISERHLNILLQIYSTIIVGAKDDEVGQYVDEFRNVFGQKILEQVHETFEKIKDHEKQK